MAEAADPALDAVPARAVAHQCMRRSRVDTGVEDVLVAALHQCQAEHDHQSQGEEESELQGLENRPGQMPSGQEFATTAGPP
ncbi:hypothetical protein [Streptomyces sp. NPDC059378]|uniref:hypothetical protein n=1 Tax=Streptomyces sp. NPDC059378 TaxID=3346815 RepID=UPI0036B1B959